MSDKQLIVINTKVNEILESERVSQTVAVFLALLLSLLSFAAQAQPYILDSDTWARPRTGREVADMAPVNQIVQEWMSITAREKTVQIRYPGGEEGSLWAFELRDWLVALGIPSTVIRLQVGSPKEDELILELK